MDYVVSKCVCLLLLEMTNKSNKTLAYYRICPLLYITYQQCFVVQAPIEVGRNTGQCKIDVVACVSQNRNIQMA